VETYQDEIYVAGVQGTVPDLPTNLLDLEGLAAQRLADRAFGYVAGGAGSGDTGDENRRAFQRWRIVPRMLTDVSAPDFTTAVLGTVLPVPLMLAPVGVLGLVHPDGECAVARAAAATGIPMVMSSASTTPIETVAQACGQNPRWFQLYWSNDRAVATSFMRRAADAGFTHLVVTLDTRMLGWRPRDLDNGYLPFLHGVGIQNYLSDPAFAAGLTQPIDDDPAAAILRYTQIFGDLSLTWSDLPFIRDHWAGPVVLKGILSPGDARRAAAAGVDGIVVSNHGGRQLDGAIAALDALPAVVDAVGDRLTVLFDSGIRTGADMIKAVALGAKAVMVGRPYAYGLGLAGEEGVRHVLRCLRADFEISMRLAGMPNLATVERDLVVRA
jgi:isopentenyl diphosphate isomerase/L-lactate dehydrogenase-like FMN-dependent dehydrogenase